jgi:hypothetical protein
MDRRTMLGAGLTVMIAGLAGCGAPAEESAEDGDADDSEGRDGIY